MSGQQENRVSISGITSATECVVTTSSAHGFSTNDFVRLTDLNGRIPTAHGMDQINNKRFKICVIDTTSFYIIDPVRNERIDSSTYPTYVTGGSCNRVENEFIYEE